MQNFSDIKVYHTFVYKEILSDRGFSSMFKFVALIYSFYLVDFVSQICHQYVQQILRTSSVSRKMLSLTDSKIVFNILSV